MGLYGALRKRDGTWESLDLFRASSMPIRRHVKIREEATEFDPAYDDYFRQRWRRWRQTGSELRERLATMEPVRAPGLLGGGSMSIQLPMTVPEALMSCAVGETIFARDRNDGPCC